MMKLWRWLKQHCIFSQKKSRNHQEIIDLCEKVEQQIEECRYAIQHKQPIAIKFAKQLHTVSLEAEEKINNL